jgi:hypothetical protein
MRIFMGHAGAAITNEPAVIGSGALTPYVIAPSIKFKYRVLSGSSPSASR